jgi:uncharacterized membrane protein SirB2
MLKQLIFVDGWVTEKLLALVYLFMVTSALKFSRIRFMRGISLMGELSWMAYAGTVAVNKQPILF